VVSVLVLSLAYPMQEYLAQRSQIAAAEQEQAELLRRIADKEERKEKWSDSAYIRAQASKRFGLVEPGVIVYHIKEDASVTDEQPGSGRPAGQTSAKAPWYGQLWSSVKAADRKAAADSPPGTPADAPAGTPNGE
jgi:hypothetical protein